MDVVNGEGPPPVLILPLVEGLPDDSMLHAMKHGGIGYLGWGSERQMLSALYDAIRDLTVVSGNWKKNKQPKFNKWPRPWDKNRKKDGTRKPVTVKDIWYKMGGKAGKFR